ncbi:MAG: hypothetical protein SangKO_006570 [Sandaracinaceae bacterium]
MHDTVTVTKANLPDFKRLFHGEVSKFVKAFLKEHGFERRRACSGMDEAITCGS